MKTTKTSSLKAFLTGLNFLAKVDACAGLKKIKEDQQASSNDEHAIFKAEYDFSKI